MMQVSAAPAERRQGGGELESRGLLEEIAGIKHVSFRL